MRILIGIAQDAGDGDKVAADLLRHITIKIFRCDHGDLAVGGRSAGHSGSSVYQRRGDPPHFHRHGFVPRRYGHGLVAFAKSASGQYEM